MTPKDIRTAIGNQCGFKKTQPQRLLESIIPNKADDSLEKEPVANNATTETGDANRNIIKKAESLGAVFKRDGKTRWTWQGGDYSCKTRLDAAYEFLLVAHDGPMATPKPSRMMDLGAATQTPNKAIQVCNAGDWPEQLTCPDDSRFQQTVTSLPESFEDWLRSNNDAIDIGGNEIPSRVQANHDRYDNERHPFT